MTSKTGMNPGGAMIVWRMVDDDSQPPKPINPHEIPAFVYAPLTLAEIGGKALVEAGVLAAFVLLFMAGAVAAFLRYDVR